MKATFSDHEEQANPLNGLRFNSKEVIGLLRSLQGRKPFVCSLQSDAGTLLVGVGRELGCVQFTSASGQPPYLIAKADDIGAEEEYVEFLSGGTPSPISRQHCLPWSLVEKVIAHFLDHGSILEDLVWEEV